MKIYTYDNTVILVNGGDSKEELPLKIIPSCNPQFTAFMVEFPAGTEVIVTPDGNLMLRIENPNFNKYNPEQIDSYRDKNDYTIFIK